MNTIKEKAQKNIEEDLEKRKVNTVKFKLHNISKMEADMDIIKTMVKRTEKFINDIEEVKTKVQLTELENQFYKDLNEIKPEKSPLGAVPLPFGGI